jgi:peroxiredoxin
MADKISRDDGRPPRFLFLSDPGHRVIDRYGLLNPEGRGWPHPATFVIDRQGVVRWKFVEVDFRIRASNEQILEALARLSG